MSNQNFIFNLGGTTMIYDPLLRNLSEKMLKPLDELLEEFDNYIIFGKADGRDDTGKVVKVSSTCPSIKCGDIIHFQPSKPKYFNENPVFGLIFAFECSVHIDPPKPKKETVHTKNLNNAAKSMKLVADWFELDPEIAMEGIKFLNQKIKMRCKLIDMGYHSKGQRKHVHDALSLFSRQIKSLGPQGAADDAAEKYKMPAKTLKSLKGFGNVLYRDPFK